MKNINSIVATIMLDEFANSAAISHLQTVQVNPQKIEEQTMEIVEDLIQINSEENFENAIRWFIALQIFALRTYSNDERKEILFQIVNEATELNLIAQVPLIEDNIKGHTAMFMYLVTQAKFKRHSERYKELIAFTMQFGQKFIGTYQ
jgi:hypothetical protein